MSKDQAYKNTDIELWREPAETEGMSYYADSIHRTEKGKIGISVGGSVFEMTLREWHKLAVLNIKTPESNSTPLSEDIEKLIDEMLFCQQMVCAGVKDWGKYADDLIKLRHDDLPALLQSQRQALIKEVEKVLPEKDLPQFDKGEVIFTDGKGKVPTINLALARNTGRNQAISEMEQALNKLAKGD